MDTNSKPHTVKELLQWAVLFLGKEKRIEAELLLAQLINFSRAKLLAYPEKIITKDQALEFREIVKLRKEGEPLQYILGREDFMALDFKVTKDVLIPRSDTEIMVEKVIDYIRSSSQIGHVLDLCTGSGAIAISLAYYLPEIKLTAVDISEEALVIARLNAQANGVEDKINFYQGDLFAALEENMKYNIIVSNPPYITSSEMEGLPVDVQKEPHLALWGGFDGLDFYRKIIKQAPDFLETGGRLFVEIGSKQGQEVSCLFKENAFTNIEVIKDWNNLDRVVSGTYL